MTRIRRSTILFQAAVLLAWLGAGTWLTGCTRVFFMPSSVVRVHPEDVGALYESVRFSSADGTPLTGLFFPARRSPAHGCVVHFHGNAENMNSHFLFASWLVDHGFHVFVFDYRGYGESGGAPRLGKVIEDGVAAIRHVRSRPDVDPSRVAVFGQSLGGAIAVAALARMQDTGVRALVLESTFSSYSRVAQDKMARLIVLWPVQWPLSRLLFTTRHDPEHHLERLPAVPVLVIHGDEDRVVPFQEGERIFRLAREPKEFWRIRGGGHTEAFTRFGREYRPRLSEFLRKAMEGRLP